MVENNSSFSSISTQHMCGLMAQHQGHVANIARSTQCEKVHSFSLLERKQCPKSSQFLDFVHSFGEKVVSFSSFSTKTEAISALF